MEFIETLRSSNLVWLILSLCTLIGFPLTIYFGHISLSQKNIKVILSDEKIFNPPSYGTVTKLTFWNNAKPTIYSTDIINGSIALTIFSKNEKFISVSVLYGEKTSNQVKVFLTNEHTAHISFNYLNTKDGGIIRVIHTGSRNSIGITRKIKGGNIKVKILPNGFDKLRFLIYMILCAMILSFIFAIDFFFILLIIMIPSLIVFALLNHNYIPKNCKRAYYRNKRFFY